MQDHVSLRGQHDAGLFLELEPAFFINYRGIHRMQILGQSQDAAEQAVTRLPSTGNGE